MSRGQSTAELAIVLPVLAMMVGITAQAGVFISDQLNLNQAAYDGAQWAIANRGTATVDSAGAGTIAQHVYTYLCGQSTAPVSTGTGHRYCESRTGVPNLSVSVTSTRPAALNTGPGVFSPVIDARAANDCNTWKLTLSPKAPPAITAGSTQTFNITLGITGQDNDDPVVALNGGGYPTGLQNGNPVFNPPSVKPGAASSKLVIATSALTPPGTYTISISGQDQCGSGPNGGDSSVTLVVTASAAPSPSPSVSAGVTIGSINPISICAGVASALTINGTGLVGGATALVGGTPLTNTVVSSTTQMTGTTPVLTAGVYNVTVTNPSGASATLNNALTVTAGCGLPAPPPPVAAGAPCAASSGSYETVITITWADPFIIPTFAGTTTPYFTLKSVQVAFCQ